MKKTITTIVAAVLTVLACSSCNKENTGKRNDSETKVISSVIPIYESDEEVLNILEIINSFDSIAQLVDYEERNGRVSIGRSSDQFYNAINPENFINQSDAIKYINDNNNVLDCLLEEDNIIVLPKWKDNPFRYIANTNGLFVIANTAYRIFNDAIVTSKIDKLNLLATMEYEELCDNSDDYTVYNYYKGVSTKGIHDLCDRTGFIRYHKKTSSGNDMIVLKVLTNILPVEDPVTHVEDHCDYFVQVSLLNLHKVLGIWWEKNRQTTAGGYVNVHHNLIDETDWSVTTNNIYLPSTNLSSKTWNIYSAALQPIGEDLVHIYGYNLSATAEGVGTVPLCGGIY